MMKPFLPAVCATILTTGTLAYEPAPTAAPAAFPCEVSATNPPPPTTSTPPAPPTNLRIIGGGGLDDLESDDTTAHGPFVDETEPVVVATAHDYYLMLAARADCIRAYSLRDPAQLDHPNNGGYAHSNSRPLVVSYDPNNDPDPRRQDGAKIVIDPSSNSLTNQVRLPIPTHAPQSLFVAWEVWFGKEWLFGIGGIPDYKTFQFGSPMHDIHMEVRNRFQLSPNTAGLIDGRLYPELGYSQGPNVTFADTLKPRVADFHVKPETWTRYFAEFKAPAAGSIWYEYSLWVADATTGPVLIYDHLQVRPSPQSTTASWEGFWLEFNTSTLAVKPGRPSLVAYARNVVMLKGVSNVGSLLVRP
jgi:hypothetical protein